jgi:hypothetical protein
MAPWNAQENRRITEQSISIICIGEASLWLHPKPLISKISINRLPFISCYHLHTMCLSYSSLCLVGRHLRSWRHRERKSSYNALISKQKSQRDVTLSIQETWIQWNVVTWQREAKQPWALCAFQYYGDYDKHTFGGCMKMSSLQSTFQLPV